MRVRSGIPRHFLRRRLTCGVRCIYPPTFALDSDDLFGLRFCFLWSRAFPTNFSSLLYSLSRPSFASQHSSSRLEPAGMASWDTYDHSRYRHDDSYNKPRRSRNDSTYASHMLLHVPTSATNTLLVSTPPIMTISNHLYTPPHLQEPGVAHLPRAGTTVEHHAGGRLRRMLKMRKTH